MKSKFFINPFIWYLLTVPILFYIINYISLTFFLFLCSVIFFILLITLQYVKVRDNSLSIKISLTNKIIIEYTSITKSSDRIDFFDQNGETVYSIYFLEGFDGDFLEIKDLKNSKILDTEINSLRIFDFLQSSI